MPEESRGEAPRAPRESPQTPPAPPSAPLLERRARLRRRFRATLCAFGLLAPTAALGLLELAARARPELSSYTVFRVHPEMGIFHPVPNQRLVDYSNPAYPHWVVTDAEGFRVVRAAPSPRDAPPLGVLALGDSFTFGFAVSGEFTYPQALQRLLETEVAARRRVAVVNGGNVWQTIDQERAIYDHLNRKRAFDYVVLGYCAHNDIPEQATISVRKQSPLASPLFAFAATHSALVRAASKGRFTAFGIPAARAAVAAGDQRVRENWRWYERRYEERFTALLDAVRARGQRFAVLCFYPPGGRDARPARFIRELCRRLGVDFLPLKLEPAHYLRFDPHLSPLGNAYVARTVAEWVQAEERTRPSATRAAPH
ncbi:MAG: SGNH/GDSL hydrolase family protein [Planctomycetota bacterium]|nr:MAG: SGNH/GDSL hydrolase family protein [Planctomycetota bacterium]